LAAHRVFFPRNLNQSQKHDGVSQEQIQRELFVREKSCCEKFFSVSFAYEKI